MPPASRPPPRIPTPPPNVGKMFQKLYSDDPLHSVTPPAIIETPENYSSRDHTVAQDIAPLDGLRTFLSVSVADPVGGSRIPNPLANIDIDPNGLAAEGLSTPRRFLSRVQTVGLLHSETAPPRDRATVDLTQRSLDAGHRLSRYVPTPVEELP